MKVTITTSSSCTPTAHATGCKDLGKVRRRRDFGGEYEIEAATLVEISLDYWSDIIGSDHGLDLDGPEAAEMAEEYLNEIAVAPCVKLPLKAPAAKAPAKKAKAKAPATPAPVTAEAIESAKAELGSWRAVAERFNLGSPNHARKLYTTLTGKPHAELNAGKK